MGFSLPAGVRDLYRRTTNGSGVADRKDRCSARCCQYHSATTATCGIQDPLPEPLLVFRRAALPDRRLCRPGGPQPLLLGLNVPGLEITKLGLPCIDAR